MFKSYNFLRINKILIFLNIKYSLPKLTKITKLCVVGEFKDFQDLK